MLSNLDNLFLSIPWLAGDGFEQNIFTQIMMHYYRKAERKLAYVVQPSCRRRRRKRQPSGNSRKEAKTCTKPPHLAWQLVSIAFGKRIERSNSKPSYHRSQCALRQWYNGHQVSSYDEITLPMHGTLWMAFVLWTLLYCNHTCAWDEQEGHGHIY